MKSYVDITLLPNADIALYFLWGKVYQQIHLALVEVQDKSSKVNLGVSFPEYENEKFQLGNKLRILAASSEEIEALNLRSWLARLSDYVHITTTSPVPASIGGYAIFKRIQLKSSNERLARRMAKRKGIGYEQAISYFEGRTEQTTKLPFINMKSDSSNHKYRLFIKMLESDELVTGEFNSYGLSKTATVPWF